MKKFKTVIFDLDGTIANTLPLCIAAFKKSIEPYLDKPLTDEEIIATFGPSEEGTINSFIPEHFDAGVAAYLDHYEKLHDAYPACFPGMEEIFQLLTERGINMGMVTGKGRKSAVLSLKKFAVEKYFDVLETGSPTGSNKVNGIKNITDKFNASLEESLYVGDAPSDVQFCQQLGIPIAAAAWAETAEPEKLEPLKPDYIFYSVNDFANWLKQRI